MSDVTFYSSSGKVTFPTRDGQALVSLDTLESLMLEIGYFDENLGWDYDDD